jgi:hypothetical protein
MFLGMRQFIVHDRYAAGPLREHPQMLASSAANQSGLLLPSNPGSTLASAEGRRSSGRECEFEHPFQPRDIDQVGG